MSSRSFIYNVLGRSEKTSKTSGRRQRGAELQEMLCDYTKVLRSLPQRSKAPGQRECFAAAHTIEFTPFLNFR